MAANSDGQIVKDVGKWEWSELWKKEDWWAIWLGFFILLAGALLYFPQAGAMKTKLMDIEAKYSQAAQRTDAMIQQLWNFTQQDPFYKDQTVFLITTDHGRGTNPLETWKSHGTKIKGADQVWLVAFGKGIQPLGEVGQDEQLYTSQIAPTILKALEMPITMEIKGTPMKL